VAKTISALEAQTRLGELMKKAYKGEERFIVEKSGIPMVAIISVDEFTSLIEAREKRFEVYDRIQAKTKGFSEKEVERDVEKAVKAVRVRSDRGRHGIN
jgi:prevent-host-death family protein